MKKLILFLTVVVLSAFVNNCGSPNFTSDTIPKERFLVGGGFSFEYTAPTSGVCYLVDGYSKKILLMESLDEGERFNEEIDPRDEDVIEAFAKMGVYTHKMKLKLYFIPASAIAVK